MERSLCLMRNLDTVGETSPLCVAISDDSNEATFAMHVSMVLVDH